MIKRDEKIKISAVLIVKNAEATLQECLDSLQNFDEIISQASLDEMIDEKGIEFVVGTNGDQLSGGQKQRIAIARALYAEKDLLILDEGFSALNPEMYQTIERNLLKQKDKTIISISHHVSNEMMALYDEILEVKNGKVCKI